MKKIIQVFLIFFVLFSSGYAASWNPTDVAEASSSKKVQAIDFTLKSTTGRTVRLNHYRGKSPVLLVFWATWCPYCKTQIPSLIAMRKTYKSRELQILAIDVDPRGKTEAFIKANDINYTVLYDAKTQGAKKASVSDLYNVRGIPMSVLIDENGQILYMGNKLPSQKVIDSVVS